MSREALTLLSALSRDGEKPSAGIVIFALPVLMRESTSEDRVKDNQIVL
jgi:hypothetical protein